MVLVIPPCGGWRKRSGSSGRSKWRRKGFGGVFGSFLGTVLASGGGLDLRAVFRFVCKGLVVYSMWPGVGRGWYGKDV